MSEGAWNAVVLFREIVQLGYTGKVTILRMWLLPQRVKASQVAVRRLETPAGYQAQVDWGEIISVDTDAGPKKLYCFVFTLGHSRAMFADVTTDTRIGTLLRMHHAAFYALGGVPRAILYDRLKTVVLGIDEPHEQSKGYHR
jgi:transposase